MPFHREEQSFGQVLADREGTRTCDARQRMDNEGLRTNGLHGIGVYTSRYFNSCEDPHLGPFTAAH